MSWPMVCLSKVLEQAEIFVDGDWVESKDQDPDGDVRLIQLADVGDGEYLDKSSRFMTSVRAGALKCTYLAPGDVLVARMPDPLGRACIFPGDKRPSVTVVDVCVIRPNGFGPDPKYLVHCLNSALCRNQIAGFATGTTRSRISRGNLAKIKIPLPPLPEQRRIAEILDKADALRAKRRAAIAQLDTLTQSIFLDMFGDPATNPKGWPVLGVEDVCDLVVDCVNRTASIVEAPTPFKMIRTTNVKSGKVDLSEVRFVTREVFDRWNRRATPRRGDVLLTREAPVGEAGIIDSDEQVFLGQRLMLYRPNLSRVTSEYLLQSFRGSFLQRQFHRHGSGTTVKHLPLPACRAFEIQVPPIELQRRFSRAIEVLREQDRAQGESLMGMSALFSSLQRRAFAGAI